MSDEYDYTIEEGQTLPLEGYVNVPGVEDPLDGARFYFLVKKSKDDADADALIKKRSPDGGMTHIAPNKCQVKITSADSTALASTNLSQKLYWQFKYRAKNGDVTPIKRGTVMVVRGIVRDTPDAPLP